MAGLSRTKVSSSGISVPIGGSMNLLQSTDTVTSGGETFLRAGITSNSGTYPLAPTKNYTASIASTNPSGLGSSIFTSLTPWGNINSIYFNNNTNSCVIHQRMSDKRMFLYDYVGNNLISFNLSGGAYVKGAGPVSVSSYLSGNSQNGSSIIGMVPTNAYDTDQRGKLAIYNKNNFTIYFFHPDTLAYTEHLLLNVNGVVPADKKQWAMPFYVPGYTDKIGFFSSNSNYDQEFRKLYSTNGNIANNVLGGAINNQTYYRTRLDHHISNNERSYSIKGSPTGQAVSTDSSFGADRFSVRSYNGGVNKIYTFQYSNGYEAFNTTVDNTFPGNDFAQSYIRNINGNINGSGTNDGIYFVKDDTYNTATEQIRGQKFNSPTTYDTPLPLNWSASNVWSGAAVTVGSVRYYGFITENLNRAYPINISTAAVGTYIDMSSQAAPYRFASDGTYLYNLNGTNVHKYQISNQTFISTASLSSQVSGTNAEGIFWDGTAYFYILDKSNSRIHKYNASWAHQSYITLAGNPHSTQTLKNATIAVGKFFVGMDSIVRIYDLDGTDRSLSVSTSGGQGSAETIGDYYQFYQNSSNSSVPSASGQRTATFDIVGVPSGSIGTTYTSYTRVS